MKDINAYLFFDGNCREAMTFYSEHFGAELELMDMSQAPGHNVPDEAKQRIMHARLSKGPAVLMASDGMLGQPLAQGANFSVSVNCESLEEIERLFKAFADQGKVTMPLDDVFWGARFGMLTDRFGINWMFSFDKPKSA
ncbi:MAG: VOC family protein [Bryobacteraceae bacterium]|nr:VOC family protein [Bryobacteraceae bacterium]